MFLLVKIVPVETIFNMNMQSAIQLLALSLTPTVYTYMSNNKANESLVALHSLKISMGSIFKTKYIEGINPQYAIYKQLQIINAFNLGSMIVLVVSIFSIMWGMQVTAVSIAMLSALAVGLVTSGFRVHYSAMLLASAYAIRDVQNK